MNANPETAPASEEASGRPMVYAAINKVMAEMAKYGISKDRKNQQQGYSFRGIDDVYNALCPAMALAGLCMLPRVLSRTTSERTTKTGGVLFYAVVEVEYDLVSSEDGSKHTIRSIGEAMDSADKATNKAMSAAYKYAAMQAFAIPTEGNPDADAETPEPAPMQNRAMTPATGDALRSQDRPPVKNNGVLDQSGRPFDMRKATEIVGWMEEAKSMGELNSVAENEVKIRQWFEDAKEELRRAYVANKTRIELMERNGSHARN